MSVSGMWGVSGFSLLTFLLIRSSIRGSRSCTLISAVVGHSIKMWVAVQLTAEQRGQVGVLFSSLCLACLYFFLWAVKSFFDVL